MRPRDKGAETTEKPTAQRFVAAGERITVVVGLSSEVGSRDHRTAARADVDHVGPQRRQEVGRPDCRIQ